MAGDLHMAGQMLAVVGASVVVVADVAADAPSTLERPLVASMDAEVLLLFSARVACQQKLDRQNNDCRNPHAANTYSSNLAH